MKRSTKIPVCYVHTRQHGSRYGGITHLPGRDGDVWGKASGYLERWAENGVGVGQLMDVEVCWIDEANGLGEVITYKRSIVLEAERIVDLGAYLVERLAGVARNESTNTALGREAHLLLDRCDFGQADCNHAMLGRRKPTDTRELERHLEEELALLQKI